MDLDTLYLLVTEAIVRADALTDLDAPGALPAHLDVSLLEERIAEVLPASNPEGVVTRRGAVRAALVGRDPRRASTLAKRFGSDPELDDDIRNELNQMLLEAPPWVAEERQALASRFPWAEDRYGIDEISRLAEALIAQAEPLPIG